MCFKDILSILGDPDTIPVDGRAGTVVSGEVIHRGPSPDMTGSDKYVKYTARIVRDISVKYQEYESKCSEGQGRLARLIALSVRLI